MSNQITSVNMTHFFNRELMMYALGDIRFKKPISLKVVAFTLAFLIVWTLPALLLFGLPTNPFLAVVYLAPPLVLGHLATRPFLDGKSLIDFTKTAILFLGESRGWADGQEFNPNEKEHVYEVDHEIWISRRREYAILADLIEAERAEAESKVVPKNKAKKRKK